MWSRFEAWLHDRAGQLVIYITLLIMGFIMWAMAVYIWRELYYWFDWVSEPSFVLTFLAIPLPYLGFMGFINAVRESREPVRRKDWLTWLGNDDPNNGSLVLLIFLFWSLLYWNWPGIALNATTISVWGLVTIFGLYLLRATLFRKPAPGQGGTGSETSKSS